MKVDLGDGDAMEFWNLEIISLEEMANFFEVKLPS